MRRRQHVKKLRVRQPAPSLDDLVLHHGDVGGGPAEGRDA